MGRVSCRPPSRTATRMWTSRWAPRRLGAHRLFLSHAPADDPVDHRFDHGRRDALTLEAVVASRRMIHARVGRCGKRPSLASFQGCFQFVPTRLASRDGRWPHLQRLIFRAKNGEPVGSRHVIEENAQVPTRPMPFPGGVRRVADGAETAGLGDGGPKPLGGRQFRRETPGCLPVTSGMTMPR
jgi:hypothetical protein